MKTIGLIGGMSWESTIPYYRLLNEGIKQQLGGLHSAKCILVSVDFYDSERMQQAGDWDAAAAMLADAARSLEAAGADFIVLCTNTMHKVADSIAAAVPIPLLHIADATAAALGNINPDAVFITTWLRQDSEAENIRVNAAMVRNLLDGLRPAKSAF